MPLNFFLKRKPKVQTSEVKQAEVKASDQPKKIENKKAPLTHIFSHKNAYAFIDASNLFWGGRESMGFNIDYQKLKKYLNERLGVTKVFYYGGVRTFEFPYSVLDNKPLNLADLYKHLTDLKAKAEEKDLFLIEKSLNKVNFYQRLEEFGYIMKIKPAKVFYAEEDENQEKPILKANCDVDMAFDMLRYMQQYNAVVAMTGDSDFAPVLSYLSYHKRDVTVISRWERTSSEIRLVAKDNFINFDKMKENFIYR